MLCWQTFLSVFGLYRVFLSTTPASSHLPQLVLAAISSSRIGLLHGFLSLLNSALFRSLSLPTLISFQSLLSSFNRFPFPLLLFVVPLYLIPSSFPTLCRNYLATYLFFAPLLYSILLVSTPLWIGLSIATLASLVLIAAAHSLIYLPNLLGSTLCSSLSSSFLVASNCPAFFSSSLSQLTSPVGLTFLLLHSVGAATLGCFTWGLLHLLCTMTLSMLVVGSASAFGQSACSPLPSQAFPSPVFSPAALVTM
jgi:hypothetical protein